jgi:aarF domain-containing kinase
LISFVAPGSYFSAQGIALVGNPEFALVDEAYPYIAKRLLTDESPRLREALRYMVYGKSGNFDMDRMIDLLEAFEDFSMNSRLVPSTRRRFSTRD